MEGEIVVGIGNNIWKISKVRRREREGEKDKMVRVLRYDNNLLMVGGSGEWGKVEGDGKRWGCLSFIKIVLEVFLYKLRGWVWIFLWG